mmetsp:Transcript_23196/g.34594  ORF Transcript_23196/g.34594 Transcript_23196/m.34594 type:complete len:297 (-) Transcript_23196:89-979(-)
MKIYNIEPTYKKSICEVELWRKSPDILPTDSDTYRFNWNGPILRRESWWRWGEWTIDIPETPEEIQEFLEDKGCATLEDYLEYHGAETIEEVLLPDQDEDEHVLPAEAECKYCWDGQGDEFTIEQTRDLNLSREDCERLEKEALRVYADEEMFEEGLIQLGWDHYSTVYEIYCTLKVTLQESEDEKYKREVSEFKKKFKANFEQFSERFGCLFDREGDNDGDDVKEECITTYQHAISKFGIDQVFKVIDDCVPFNTPVLHEGASLQPFMIAALCENSPVAVIYHFLRKDPSHVRYC